MVPAQSSTYCVIPHYTLNWELFKIKHNRGFAANKTLNRHTQTLHHLNNNQNINHRWLQ